MKWSTPPPPVFLFLTLILLPLLAGSAGAATLQEGLEARLDRLGADDMASVILFMRDQAPVSELNTALRVRRAPLAERHATVITALKEASASQADLLSALSTSQSRGEVAGFTSYWIANLVIVEATKAFIYQLASREDIERIESNFTASLVQPFVDPSSGEPTRGIGVTPGLRAINADRVWYELGITGAGVLCGTCDTGVDGTHPALADRWRGTHAPADECWLDVLGGHPDFPYDGYGHGTHVQGTVCGLGAATQDTVGVAWAAEWIACNPIDQSVGSEFDNDIIVSYQWLADPDGDPYTTDDVPDVIQNSWRINEDFPGGYSDCDSRWWAVIDNCEAAGVVTTWSAGNEGPYSETIGSPADRATTLTNCFSVGAVDATNYSYPWPIAGFSSRGPTGCDVPAERKIKPEVSGPGVDVYSSIPGGGYSGTYSGTSMSGPHVAGVAALMREANPDLDVDTVKEIIMSTAMDLGDAGEDNTFGWGMVDAYEAVMAVMQGYGTVSGTVTNASNGNTPIPGATVEVVEVERSTTTAGDGSYAVSVPADTYTLTATHPSFAPESAYGVVVDDGGTTVQHFALTDIAGPEIAGTTELRSTEDETGPYMVDATITDFSDLASTRLRYRVNGGPWQNVTMVTMGGDLYSGGIPGQEQLALIDYYVMAGDVATNASVDPPGAPAELYSFYVAPIEELMADDMEAGAPDWTHAAVGGGFTDQWHLSTQRNHTPAGATSWKCGDTGTGDYDNLLDAGLVTPPVELGVDSYLHFWHWMDAETSSAHPEYAYDGGRVEISVDGAPFVQIFPEEGYTHLVREGGTPGPFEPDSWIYSGQFDWTEANFNLGAYEGTAQLRFRFGSDGAVTAEGWFVDDVMVDGFVVDFSAVEQRPEALRVLLRSADPNPFAGRTTLRYALPSASDVSLQVFDLGGRLVRTLVHAAQPAGSYVIDWDGRDDASRPLPSGVYLTQLKAGAAAATHKVIITR